jgi:hypothetical protein
LDHLLAQYLLLTSAELVVLLVVKLVLQLAVQ